MQIGDKVWIRRDTDLEAKHPDAPLVVFAAQEFGMVGTLDTPLPDGTWRVVFENWQHRWEYSFYADELVLQPKLEQQGHSIKIDNSR